MKRFLPYLLIGMIIMGSFSAIFTPAHKTEAALPLLLGIPLINWIAAGLLVGGTVGYVTYREVTIRILDMTVGAIIAELSKFIFWLTSQLMTLAGNVLDLALNEAVEGNLLNLSAINVGWSTCRDVANLFFIFILLYIAIATILQLSSYGMKALLTRLIIIALLVNFSLMITKIIIDASNILANEFYNKMKIQTVADHAGPGFSAGDPIEIISPSLVFMNALKLQTLLSDKGIEALKLTNLNVAMVFLGGTIVVLISMFVFFAGAILLIIRTVALIILMILAPLAFLFMVLPLTKSYAQKWWETLFKYSFFAPAFMFMLYLSARVLSDPNFARITGSEGKIMAEAFLSGVGGVTIIFSFIIVIALMVASLIIAQQMGVYGASTVVGWGKAAGKWGRGVAGRAARRTAIARPMRAVTESRWAQRLATISPRFGGALLRTAQKGAKVGGLDKITEAKAATGMSLSPEDRARYLRRADKRTQDAMFKQMSSRDRADLYTKDKELYDNLLKKAGSFGALSLEERDKTEKERREVGRRNIVNNLYNTQTNTVSVTFANDVRQVRPDEVKDLNMGIFRDAAGAVQTANIDAMTRAFSGAHINKMYERGDEAANLFFQRLAALGNTNRQIADQLRAMGNQAAASWALTPGAAAVIDAYRP